MLARTTGSSLPAALDVLDECAFCDLGPKLGLHSVSAWVEGAASIACGHKKCFLRDSSESAGRRRRRGGCGATARKSSASSTADGSVAGARELRSAA
eukprot:1052980-Prymnesium_polylepis.1